MCLLTPIHRRWINFFLTSSNSYFDTPPYFLILTWMNNIALFYQLHCTLSFQLRPGIG